MKPLTQNIDSQVLSFPSLQTPFILKIAVLGLLLSILFRIESTNTIPYLFSSFAAIAILFSVFILPLRYIIYPLFALIILMPDLTRSFEEKGIAVSSPWQLSLGPLSPAIFIFIFLLIIAIRLSVFSKRSPYNLVFLYFFGVATITSLLFGFFQESVHRFLIDAKIPMYFCTGLFIFSSYYKKFPNELLTSSQVFIAFATGNFLLDILKFFFSNNESMESVNNLSFDSAKGLILIFTFWGISQISENRNRILSLIIILISLYIILAYQTRWLLVSFFLGLIAVLLLIGVGKTIKVSLPLFIFLLVSIPLMIKIAPDVWRIAMARFTFIDNLSNGATLMDVEMVRAGSIYNSVNLLWEKKSFLTGMGYGSWFNDSFFPMPFLTSSAFDDESLQIGKYYRVHDFFFHFLFKFGIIGTCIYVAAFLKPLKIIWRFRHQIRKNHFFRQVGIFLFGLCPLVITYMYWTGKGLLFSALFIVIAYEWTSFLKKSINETNSSIVRHLYFKKIDQ